MRTPLPSVLLATAGLGFKAGGVGIVAEHIQRTLATRYRVQHLEYQAWSGLRARLRFGAAQLAQQFTGHERQFYVHVDLARLLPRMPHLAKRDYGVWVHGTDVWCRLDRQRLAALAGARWLFASSQFTVERMQSYNPELRHAKAIALGVDTNTDMAADTRAPTLPRAVITSRMVSTEREKGQQQLIEAWPEIMRAVPGAELVCIGTGDDVPRLQALAVRIGANVRFPGAVSNVERDALLKSARVFGFPSTQEGFGLAAVEAAALGLPVLITRGTVLEEIFGDNPGALKVAQLDAALIPQAIIPALKNPGLSAQLGAAAQALVRSKYLYAHFAARFWAAFDAS
jgi:glycosyltransferase involved in cell wall biosynthesis